MSDEIISAEPSTIPPPVAPPVSSRPPARTPLRANPVTYDGSGWKIFGMMVVNFLLSVLTLGIYSFWGKTRIRRYLVSSVAVNGTERLQYTGTALELLFGWLKAMLFVVPVIIGLGWAAETKHYIIYFIFLLGFTALFYLGTYLGLRYRFTRIKWRGIRFGLRGKALEYMKLSLIRYVMNVVTLGYLIPASDIKKWDYIANNMSFGKRTFGYKGTPQSLIKVNLITLWLPLLPILLMVATSWTDLVAFKALADQAKTDPKAPMPTDMAESIGYMIFAFYGLLFLGFIGRLWYRAALRAERLRGLRLGGIRFKSTATGMQYFTLKICNILIMIVTLGWGFAIVKNRNMRFESTTILVGGDLDLLVAEQEEANAKSDIGDALAPDLDMGGAISIGI